MHRALIQSWQGHVSAHWSRPQVRPISVMTPGVAIDSATACAEEALFRSILAVILGASILISGYHRHRARRSGETIARRQEDRRLILLRLGFGLPLVLSLIGYLVWPPSVAWSRLPFPVEARWFGVALGSCGPPLVFWVMRSLGSNISETVLTKRQHQLVTHGPYRWVRHPLYSTGLLILVSATLITTSVLTGALTVITAVAIRLVVVPREERALLEKFSDEYRTYMSRTGRFLPVFDW
jgi:protein-S-isoprenylcysteine O-methyltransferase Ste14